MKEKVGKHSLMKEINRKLILRLLCNTSLSCQDIVDASGLSYTGVVTLIDEMVEENLLIRKKDNSASGRKSLVFSINPRYGLFYILKLIGNCSIILCAFDGTQIAETPLNIVGKIQMSDMQQAVSIMKDMLNKFEEYGKLFRITIIASGKINKHDGSFMHSPAFEDYKNMNLRDFFTKSFEVETDIKNDIRFSLLAEKAFGEHKEQIGDTLYLQLGSGISSALFLDGKLYEGSSGLNGEVGYFIVDAVTNSTNYLMSDTSNYYLSNASYEHIVKVVNFAISKHTPSILDGKTTITLDDIVLAYNKNDKLCCDAVNATISITAAVIKSLAEVLDFSNVIISKKTMIFGDKYIKTLREMLLQFTEISIPQIFLSTFDANGVVVGAKQYAMDKIISKVSKKKIE